MLKKLSACLVFIACGAVLGFWLLWLAVMTILDVSMQWGM